MTDQEVLDEILKICLEGNKTGMMMLHFLYYNNPEIIISVTRLAYYIMTKRRD